MMFEQYHWKKAMKKGEPYKFKVCLVGCVPNVEKKAEILKLSTDFYETQLVILWVLKILEPYNLRQFFFLLLQWNEYMDRDHRESYYFNWPVYFP